MCYNDYADVLKLKIFGGLSYFAIEVSINVADSSKKEQL